MLISKRSRQICAVGGVLLTATTMFLSWSFGITIGTGVALAIVTFSFLAAFMPVVCFELYHTGARRLAAAGIGIAVALAGLDMLGNVSTVGAERGEDLHLTKISADNHSAKEDELAGKRAARDLLIKQRDALVEKNGWIPTTSADALRGQIPALEEAIRQEAANVRCGPKCLGYKKDLADLQTRIGLVEQSDNLDARIEATDRAIATLNDEIESAPQRFSATKTQVSNIASLRFQTETPTDSQQYWTNMVIFLIIGVLLTPSSIFLNLVGFGGMFSAPEGSDRHKDHLTLADLPRDPPRPTVPMNKDQKALAQLNQAPQTIVLNNADDTVRQTFSSIWQRANALAA